ncbi:Alpha/Beta hydrolase protein [Amylocarpus encephaloides]|uniref:Alpha/Beta hydrolase protein n=1 Tax=Amylocarpus encephaloides TaxID=45428 RepID=A0A9P7YEI5_9HELO|nr:Alpha/Beta hydrolase protein [Amylocarpus encephaloides]
MKSTRAASGKIHEYGGGAASMCRDGRVVFTDSEGGGVFFLLENGEVEERVGGRKGVYFGDFDGQGTGKYILAVREVHFGDGREVENCIVSIDVKDGSVRVLAEGADFYSHPRFSRDGKRVCWKQWNHPDMPWTGSELYVAEWNEGTELLKGNYVAGKAGEQAICQPRWAWDGALWHEVEKGEDVEIGKREIYMGNTTYIQLSPKKLLITYCRNATDGLIVYDIPTQTVIELPLELVHIEFHGLARISDTSFAVLGSTAKTPPALYIVDITKPSEKKLLKISSSSDLPLSTFSPATSISFPRTHGTPGIAHAIFSPPSNPLYTGPEGANPPLIISIHGGPTSHVTPRLNLEAQYFTSRGFAFADVNYTGSIGYGRAYREALNYYRGIKDVEDTLFCIDFLASQNLIERSKVGIRGGSAGGYTVLQSLVHHPNVFASGCSLYGVGNLKDFVTKTHKFESHYLFNLLFPSDTLELDRGRIYKTRSLCLHGNKIEAPLLLLQGDKDNVVLLSQGVDMERVLREKGKDVRLVVFEGEGHGWKGSEAIKRSVEEEEGLWGRTLVG